MSPRIIAIMPFTSESPERLATADNPNTIRAKYSGGPKFKAQFAISGANSISPTTPSVPAI